jgi:calnexin
LQGAFVKSTSPDYADMPVEVAEAKGVRGIEGDLGLVLLREARRYALTAPFQTPVRVSADGDDRAVVVQYEVRLQEGLTCGGAYLKLYEARPGFSAAGVNPHTPYAIMFGPDRCGATDKVHLILRWTNPVDGSVEEKHMTDPPRARGDTVVHLYTLVLRPDGTFSVKIDGAEVRGGRLDSPADFSPAILPPERINDPTDSKPADWVDEAEMADPEASKPADWDDDAPVTVPDMDAQKPSGWLDDEPDYVPDPHARRPEGWDDDEDGEWTAPQVPNPRCEVASGCGPWARPSKRNPAYRGKWAAPRVPNPAYRGEWKPRQVANPAYFTDAHLHRLGGAGIGGVGIEVWTMNAGLLFDNVLVTRNETEAQDFAAATFTPKHAVQAAAAEEESRELARREREAAAAEGGILEKLVYWVGELFLIARGNPLMTLGSLVAAIATVSVACYAMCATNDPDVLSGMDGAEARIRGLAAGAARRGDGGASAAGGRTAAGPRARRPKHGPSVADLGAEDSEEEDERAAAAAAAAAAATTGGGQRSTNPQGEGEEEEAAAADDEGETAGGNAGATGGGVRRRPRKAE